MIYSLQLTPFSDKSAAVVKLLLKVSSLEQLWSPVELVNVVLLVQFFSGTLLSLVE